MKKEERKYEHISLMSDTYCQVACMNYMMFTNVGSVGSVTIAKPVWTMYLRQIIYGLFNMHCKCSLWGKKVNKINLSMMSCFKYLYEQCKIKVNNSKLMADSLKHEPGFQASLKVAGEVAWLWRLIQSHQHILGCFGSVTQHSISPVNIYGMNSNYQHCGCHVLSSA